MSILLEKKKYSIDLNVFILWGGIMTIETENFMYQKLLHTIYEYLLNEKCAHLDLDNLERIVVVSNNELPAGVDARFENRQVLVKEESVKNSLSHIKEKDINKYIFEQIKDLSDNKTKLLIDNVMHELFHCDAEKKMPALHSMIRSDSPEPWKGCMARFWIEFTVEYNSHKNSFLRKEKLLEQISNAQWEIDCFFGDKNEEKTMYKLIYVASYFVPLNLLYGTEEKYLKNVNDKQIYNLYSRLFAICRKLIDKEKYIDGYSEIMSIENVFKDYFDKLNVKTFWK